MSPPDDPDDRPTYRRYRARRRLFGGREEPLPRHDGGGREPAGAADDTPPAREPRPRAGDPRPHDPAAAPADPRDRGGGDRYGGDARGPAPAPPPAPRRPRRRLRRPPGLCRVAKALVALIVAWLLLSLVVFLVSAQIHQTHIEGGLGGAGFPLTSANTVLVLGSDARPEGKGEPGSGGPSRSDSIMLLRVGGGANSRLSIPRDMLADIPGHGVDKINAAYAYGGTDLAVRTVEQFLDIRVNHVIDVNFTNFPRLIDAMGGVTYHGSCVVSRINGGFKNGGYTLRLPAGKTHIDGRQALALARTRKNLCNPRETDIARAQRQQKLLGAMRSRMTSPGAFVRMPWIAWQAPQALRSDMSGPTMLGLFGGLMIGGSATTRVLRPTGQVVTASGQQALTITDEAKQRAVRAFLRG